MAAPNIVNVSTITAKTAGYSLSSVEATNVLNNSANSNKVLKINTMNVANTTANSCPVTVSIYSLANLGGTDFPIVSNVTVPPNSTLTVIDKTTQYYLEENSSIGARPITAASLVVTVSYEEIS